MQNSIDIEKRTPGIFIHYMDKKISMISIKYCPYNNIQTLITATKQTHIPFLQEHTSLNKN